VWGVIQDITDRKKAEAEREETAKEMLLLLKSMINCFAVFESIFNEQGAFVSYRFAFINEAYERVTSVRGEDVIGKTVHQVWPGTEQSWIDNYGEVALTGKTKSFEMYHEPTKKLYYCNVYRPWESTDRFCVIFEDITEKKRAQEELITMEKRLLHAQKLESLGILSGGIAHDFNNLLTVIIGNVQLAMLDCDRISPAGRSLTKALEAANRSANLACQMLAYSGKGAFDIRNVNLSSIVADNAHLLRSAIAKTVNMEIELDDNMADVKCDAGQMQQLIMNLIINASEALEGKSGTVKLCTGVRYCDEALLAQSLLIEKPRPQDMAFIRVSDDGCGMDAETINRIFDPFFTSKFTGRGLGMSVVHGIVKGHFGAITVQSEPGKGTTIAVYFPVYHERENGRPETLTQPSVNESQIDRGSESQKLSILVVDDEKQVRDLMVEILNMLGHKTFSAVDGKEAIEIFNNNPDIDIVALDLTMPEMDGVETFQQMIQVKPNVKVILCSGYSPEEIRSRFTKGCIPAAFLKKPYGLSALKSAIYQVIQGSNQRNQT
jgi:PAS domain S-box-containing protein